MCWMLKLYMWPWDIDETETLGTWRSVAEKLDLDNSKERTYFYLLKRHHLRLTHSPLTPNLTMQETNNTLKIAITPPLR